MIVSSFVAHVNVKVMSSIMFCWQSHYNYTDVQQQWDRLIDSRFMLGKRIVNDLTSWPPVKMLKFPVVFFQWNLSKTLRDWRNEAWGFLNFPQSGARSWLSASGIGERLHTHTQTRVERWRRWGTDVARQANERSDCNYRPFQNVTWWWSTFKRGKLLRFWLTALSSLWFWWNFSKEKEICAHLHRTRFSVLSCRLSSRIFEQTRHFGRTLHHTTRLFPLTVKHYSFHSSRRRSLI